MSVESHRGMPTLVGMVNYWRDHYTEVFPNLKASWIGWGEPFCFRCNWLVPVEDPYTRTSWSVATGWLERGHLHDRSGGGSNEASNLVPLCQFCHRSMPEFPEGSEQAIAWINEGIKLPPNTSWQIKTDSRWAGEKYPGWDTLYRAKSRLDEQEAIRQAKDDSLRREDPERWAAAHKSCQCGAINRSGPCPKPWTTEVIEAHHKATVDAIMKYCVCS
jgi:hypothetical protein